MGDGEEYMEVELDDEEYLMDNGERKRKVRIKKTELERYLKKKSETNLLNITPKMGSIAANFRIDSFLLSNA